MNGTTSTKNSLERDNMSRGIIIPAFNTVTADGDVVNYINMARCNASVIRQVWGMDYPLTLITDTAGYYTEFDDVILVGSPDKTTKRFMETPSGSVINYEWKNNVRIQCYDRSPYDKTLVIDADYILQTEILKYWFDTPVSFMMPRSVYDIVDDRVERFNPKTMSIPQRWATWMYFEKSDEAQAVFDMAKTVVENYTYYASLLGFQTSPFRNDYVFTIAMWMLSIDTDPYSHPNSGATSINCLSSDYDIEVQTALTYSGTKDVLTIKNDELYNYIDSDIHIMNKFADFNSLRKMRFA